MRLRGQSNIMQRINGNWVPLTKNEIKNRFTRQGYFITGSDEELDHLAQLEQEGICIQLEKLHGCTGLTNAFYIYLGRKGNRPTEFAQAAIDAKMKYWTRYEP